MPKVQHSLTANSVLVEQRISTSATFGPRPLVHVMMDNATSVLTAGTATAAGRLIDLCFSAELSTKHVPVSQLQCTRALSPCHAVTLSTVIGWPLLTAPVQGRICIMTVVVVVRS